MRSPSLTAIPADSWPRCWRTVQPVIGELGDVLTRRPRRRRHRKRRVAAGRKDRLIRQAAVGLWHTTSLMSRWRAGTATRPNRQVRREVGAWPAGLDGAGADRFGPRSRPVASRIQVTGSVSTTLGGVPRVCRGPGTHCTAATGGSRTSMARPGTAAASRPSRYLTATRSASGGGGPPGVQRAGHGGHAPGVTRVRPRARRAPPDPRDWRARPAAGEGRAGSAGTARARQPKIAGQGAPVYLGQLHQRDREGVRDLQAVTADGADGRGRHAVRRADLFELRLRPRDGPPRWPVPPIR